MKKKKRNLLCVLLSAAMCFSMIPAETAEAITLYTASGNTIVKNADQIKGTENGYSYELWNQNDAGTATMKLGEGGAYSCEWSNIENVLFRRGVDFDCTKTYKELGNISIEYDADYDNPTQNTYLCVYGWTRDPLIEYYIVDSWGSWRPPGADSTMGTITVDGGTYDVYVTDRINQPSIDGNTTFKQYWSVRRSKRTSGTISVSQHFAEWEKLGMETGKLYEAALNVEGYMSSGKADVKKNIVTVGGEITPIEPIQPIEPDANGYYFHSTFEDGKDDWESRGDATVSFMSSNAYEGSKCLSVVGRTDSWNGTARYLDTAAFVPGKSYSFSTMARQDVIASEEFKLTLQYTLNGEANYSTIAEATGKKGEWTQLANTSYTIPENATELLVYVETPDSTTDFYIDNAIGAVDGTVINADAPSSKGDVNSDGKVDKKDAALLQKHIVGLKVSIDFEAADMNDDGKVNINDLCILKNAASSSSSSSTTATEYMANVRKSITANVPSSATASGQFGKLQQIEYYSSTASKTKKANVLLPEGYSTNEKYPVLYVNHGIFGDQNSMLGMGVPEIAGNLSRTGEAEKMIIVFPQMYSGSDCEIPSGITQEAEANYDKFLDDLTKDLMPYIEKNYSVKTGRENTAIAGFSMGGRETLYIGISRPDIFGYIGAACPAPGVTPGTDYAGYHSGSLTEDQLKISNKAYEPYILMITGGTNDSVVGTFPQSYHDILTKNGQDHIWQEIQGGGHDNSCVVPMMYNFIRNIFKTGKSSGSGTTTTPTGGVDISWIDPSKPMVAISFDDGAVGTAYDSSSMRILNALNQSDFHATFFYVSNWVNNADKEAEVKKAFDMGMEIANHTASHPDLTTKSAAEIKNEYDTCANKLKSIIGTDPSPLLRLPYLSVNDSVKSTLSNAPLITCAIDTADWNNATADQIVTKIKNAMNDGSLNNSIVLAHETYGSTAEAMEILCPYLKSQGWQIVTISEMFAVKGKTLNGGQVYTKCN